MKLTGAEIANSGRSKFTQDVVCNWCLTASTLDLGPQHVTGDIGLHCRKCGKFSMHRTADKWFDQHQERMDELKDVWKKVPGDAYLTCRQNTKGTPYVYTLFLGGAKRPEEFKGRDMIEHILTNEYGMSYKQAHGIIMSACLTPGQRIYLQRHVRLVMAAETREEMKKQGTAPTLRAGSPVRVNGQDGIFLRYSSNDGFAIVALPTPGIGGFGDAEVPVMDLEVVDAGGPEVAEDFEFDKAMDDDMAMGGGGLSDALEHLEQAEEIVEDLVLEEGGKAHMDAPDMGGEKHEEHEEKEEKEEEGDLEARRLRAAMPLRAPGMAQSRPGMDPNLDQRLRSLQQIIQDPNTDPQTLQVAQERYTNLKRQIPAHALGERDVTAFFNYKTEDDMKALERPDHKTKGPDLTDTKFDGDSWVPRNDGDNPLPKEDKNLDKTANREAQRRVHTHYSHSGDLKRAIEVNQGDLSIEDIRDLCKFYANTGKIAHFEADELAYWFIGDKPRLLCASDRQASPRYEEWARNKNKQTMQSECTCKGAYDRYCPEHGAQDSRASKEEKHTCSKCGESWTSARKPPVCPYCDGKKESERVTCTTCGGGGCDRCNWSGRREARYLSAKDAGEVTLPDNHPESGLTPGSGGDCPDPKWQKGDSANSVSGPEKVKDHGTSGKPKESGDVKEPDLGVPKGASMRRRADGICQKCGTPLNQAGQCPTCQSGAEQQQAQESSMQPTTARRNRLAAKHKDGCGCGFCESMRGNIERKKPKQANVPNQKTKLCPKHYTRHPTDKPCPECKEKSALSVNDFTKVAYDQIGVFMPAMHKGSRVLVIAIDNTSLRATVQDGSGNQWQVDVADLEPVKTGPYSGVKR